MSWPKTIVEVRGSCYCGDNLLGGTIVENLNYGGSEKTSKVIKTCGMGA